EKKMSMKNILLVLLGVINIVFAGKTSAQTFTVPHDTINATYHSDQLTMYSTITNISANPINIKWRVLSHNFPPGWTSHKDALGICDNVLCRQNDGQIFTNGSGTSYTTADIPVGNTEDQGLFYIILLDINNAESGTY